MSSQMVPPYDCVKALENSSAGLLWPGHPFYPHGNAQRVIKLKMQDRVKPLLRLAAQFLRNDPHTVSLSVNNTAGLSQANWFHKIKTASPRVSNMFNFVPSFIHRDVKINELMIGLSRFRATHRSLDLLHGPHLYVSVVTLRSLAGRLLPALSNFFFRLVFSHEKLNLNGSFVKGPL